MDTTLEWFQARASRCLAHLCDCPLQSAVIREKARIELTSVRAKEAGIARARRLRKGAHVARRLPSLILTVNLICPPDTSNCAAGNLPVLSVDTVSYGEVVHLRTDDLTSICEQGRRVASLVTGKQNHKPCLVSAPPIFQNGIRLILHTQPQSGCTMKDSTATTADSTEATVRRISCDHFVRLRPS